MNLESHVTICLLSDLLSISKYHYTVSKIIEFNQQVNKIQQYNLEYYKPRLQSQLKLHLELSSDLTFYILVPACPTCKPSNINASEWCLACPKCVSILPRPCPFCNDDETQYQEADHAQLNETEPSRGECSKAN